MNIEFCKKCFLNSFKIIYMFDKEDEISSIIINHDNHFCSFVVRQRTRSKKLFQIFDKSDILDKEAISKNFFCADDETLIKQVEGCFKYIKFSDRVDNFGQCPYCLEQQLYDWNKK